MIAARKTCTELVADYNNIDEALGGAARNQPLPPIDRGDSKRSHGESLGWGRGSISLASGFHGPPWGLSRKVAGFEVFLKCAAKPIPPNWSVL
jgi:hypothetical protein